MRYLITADLHLGRNPENRSIALEALQQMFSYCRQNDLDAIIVAGDLFHHKSVLYSVCVNDLLDLLEKNRDVAIVVLDGNHDLSDYSENAVSALRVLENEPNVTWIKKAEKMNDVFFVPFSKFTVPTIKESKSKYLISHIGLDEATLSSGISIVSDLKIRDLVSRYEISIFGHYHKPQELRYKDTTVYYVGSPYQIDWGERNEEKRFLVLDTESGGVVSEKTNCPRYYLLTVQDTSDIKTTKEQAKTLLEGGNKVLVQILDKEINVSEFDGIPVIKKVATETIDRGITREMSLEEKLRRYLKVREIPEEEHDSYIAIAKDIIQESSERTTEI